jgi:hypothetical protein
MLVVEMIAKIRRRTFRLANRSRSMSARGSPSRGLAPGENGSIGFSKRTSAGRRAND